MIEPPEVASELSEVVGEAHRCGERALTGREEQQLREWQLWISLKFHSRNRFVDADGDDDVASVWSVDNVAP